MESHAFVADSCRRLGFATESYELSLPAKNMSLGKFHHDLTVLPHWKSWFILGEHPQMTQQFRLMKSYNLPR